MNLLTSMRYLVALNEHKHFGRAAAACHITQPALSNALRALEQEFDVVIVRRDRSYVGLTPEGERVLASAYVLLREADVLKQELTAGSDVVQGTVRIGAVPTAVPIAARFATMLRERHSGIQPTVLSLSSGALERGLEELAIDLGLGYTERMNPSSRLRSIAQYTEHYFLVRRAPKVKRKGLGSGLRFGAVISWREAAQFPLCLLGREMHNRTIVDSAFTTAGVSVVPAMETNSILTLMLSVATADVCSVLPGALVATIRHDSGLEALPLHGPSVQTPIGLMAHNAVRPSRALEAALALAQSPEWQALARLHSGSMGVAPESGS